MANIRQLGQVYDDSYADYARTLARKYRQEQGYLAPVAIDKITAAMQQGLNNKTLQQEEYHQTHPCLLYTSPSPRDRTRSRMPSSA